MANVLIVDDNEQNLYLLETLLVNRGHHVSTAGNGKQALDKARIAPPDVVVTDILMPEMDGFTLCRQWKSDQQLCQRPVVFYTAAYTDSRDEELALRLGADRFICKPAKVEELVAALDDVLDGAKRKDSLTGQDGVDETAFLKQYNEVLVRKLEEKVDELQSANQELSQMVNDLRAAQSTLRVRDRALASSPTGIAIVDSTTAERAIIDCNQAFLVMTGYAHEEVIGRPFGFLESGHDDQPELTQIAKAMRAHRSCRVVLRSYKKDGSFFWNRLTISPVHEDQRLTHYVCVHEDVTESRKAEGERQDREMQLAHVSRVSTMGEIVSGIAHELNQPLYTIQNYSKACSNLLGRDPTAAEQLNAWLEEITGSAEHAGELLGKLRDFVTRAPAERTAINLGEIVDAALSLVHREAQKRGVKIEVATAELPDVFADSVQIQQVLLNLILNAFDSVQQQTDVEPRVVISAQVQEGLVETVVSDNGVGLPDEHDVRIFEAFQSTKRNGMGLGLAIATTIVNSHGGELWAGAGQDGGAAFHFTLPSKNKGQ